MTLEEKRQYLNDFCGSVPCKNCPLNIAEKWSIRCRSQNCLLFSQSPEHEIDEALRIIGVIEKSESKLDDPVNHPSHYTDGKIEVIDFIEDKKLGFCLGNAVKYIARAGKKDPAKEIEDLKKAVWYIERRIKEIEEGVV